MIWRNYNIPNVWVAKNLTKRSKVFLLAAVTSYSYKGWFCLVPVETGLRTLIVINFDFRKTFLHENMSNLCRRSEK